MNRIIETNSPEQDLAPEFALALRPILAKWEAAIMRVAAAETRPALLSTVPDANTPEGILLQRFKSLPAEAKQASAKRATRYLNNNRVAKKLNPFLKLGQLEAGASVDTLAKVVPINTLNESQVKALTPERFASIGAPVASPIGAAAASPIVFKSLRLELFRLVCIDETNGFWGSERGEDEIRLSGVAFDETADIGKLAVVNCGDFDDGTRRDFNPTKRLFTFNLTEGATFPKSYVVTLLLVEHDFGNLSETVNAMIEKLKKEATAALSDLISGETGIPPWLIAVAVGWLVNKIANKIVAIWEDDLFKPQTIGLVRPSASATFANGATSSSRVVHFSGPGEYAMRYIWTLSTSADGS